MYCNGRLVMGMAIAVVGLVGNVPLAQAGSRDAYVLARELECKTQDLVSAIDRHFHCHPRRRCLIDAAHDLHVRAGQVRSVLGDRCELPAVIREVNCLERDAGRLENELEDIETGRFGITGHCLSEVVQLADCVEDLADDLGDALPNWVARRPTYPTAPYGRGRYVPAPDFDEPHILPYPRRRAEPPIAVPVEPIRYRSHDSGYRGGQDRVIRVGPVQVRLAS